MEQYNKLSKTDKLGLILFALAISFFLFFAAYTKFDLFIFGMVEVFEEFTLWLRALIYLSPLILILSCLFYWKKKINVIYLLISLILFLCLLHFIFSGTLRDNFENFLMLLKYSRIYEFLAFPVLILQYFLFLYFMRKKEYLKIIIPIGIALAIFSYYYVSINAFTSYYDEYFREGGMKIESDLYIEFSTCKDNCVKVEKALYKYYEINHHYPNELSKIEGSSIDKIPKCPSSNEPYKYEVNDCLSRFTFYCQGNSHKPAGMPDNYPVIRSKK